MQGHKSIKNGGFGYLGQVTHSSPFRVGLGAIMGGRSGCDQVQDMGAISARFLYLKTTIVFA